jgi:membrane protease YdiL (CAAX protease family)
VVEHPESPMRSMHAWQALGLTMMAAAATLGFQLLVAGSFAVFRGTDLPEGMSRVSEHPLSLAVAQGFGFGVVIVLGFRRFVGHGGLPSVGLGPPPPLSLLALCAAAGLALQMPLSEIANAVHEIVPMPLETQLARQALLDPSSLADAVTILLTFVIVAPTVEEILFRGLIVPATAKRHGELVAVLLGAVLFAFVHLDWAGSAYALIAGLLLGALRLRTGSLWPCVVLHAAVNAVPVLLPRSIVSIEGFNVPSEEVLHLAPSILFPSLLVAAVTLAWLERRTRRE